MKKLYDENPYQKEFTAEIINILEKDNQYHVELDKTYFYPGDEIQPCDSGSISEFTVSKVYEENGKTYHVLKVKPLKIHRAKCSINWDTRYDYMQQHLGQHILSASLSELFATNTIKVQLGEKSSYIDINKIIEATEIPKIEELVNKIVFDNLKVEIIFPTNAELKKLSLKKSHLRANEENRVVKIGDFTVSLCEGLHPSSTIEVQIIKIMKLGKLGNGTRIEFICGLRAVSDYLSKFRAIENIARLLSCEEDKVISIVENLKGDLNKALTEKGALKAEVADYEVQNMLASCDNIDGVRILKTAYDNVDLKYITLLAQKLTSFPKVIVLFGAKFEDKANLIFMCSKDLSNLNMNLLLKDSITLIDGNGGGSNFSAQGGGKNNNNLDSSLQYAYKKIVDLITSTGK